MHENELEMSFELTLKQSTQRFGRPRVKLPRSEDSKILCAPQQGRASNVLVSGRNLCVPWDYAALTNSRPTQFRFSSKMPFS